MGLGENRGERYQQQEGKLRERGRLVEGQDPPMSMAAKIQRPDRLHALEPN